MHPPLAFLSKNKIGASNPPSPETPLPKTTTFMDMGGFPAERAQKMPAAHKIGTAILWAPELQAEKLRT